MQRLLPSSTRAFLCCACICCTCSAITLVTHGASTVQRLRQSFAFLSRGASVLRLPSDICGTCLFQVRNRFLTGSQSAALLTAAEGLVTSLERRVCSEAPPCQSSVARVLSRCQPPFRCWQPLSWSDEDMTNNTEEKTYRAGSTIHRERASCLQLSQSAALLCRAAALLPVCSQLPGCCYQHSRQWESGQQNAPW